MKKKTHESYSFRLPIELLAWIKTQAQDSCRPMAKQVEYIIRKAKEEETASK